MKSIIRNMALALAVSGIALTAAAQEAKRDPKVQALFDSCVAVYKPLSSYQARISFKYVPDKPLFPQAQPMLAEIKAQKPNKLSLNYTEKGVDGKTVRYQVVSDGQNVYRWQSDTNAYTKTKAGNGFPDLPPSLSLPDLDLILRSKDPFKSLDIPANLLTIGKPVKVGDVELDAVDGKVSGSGIPFVATLRMLFGKKDHAFRGLIFEGEGKDRQERKPLTFHVEANYDLLNLSPTLAAADFTFTPPAGAKLEQPSVRGQGIQ